MIDSGFPKSVGLQEWLALALVCGFLITSSGCARSPSSASPIETPVGSTAPRSNLPMPPVNAPNDNPGGQNGWILLDNRHAKLADYAGQVVVLDFWKTDCAPCLEEAPHLVELQKRYGIKGLTIIGLNVGSADDHAKVLAFAETFKIQYSLGYPDSGTTNLYLGNPDGIPQTLVFDRQGKLVKRFVGFDQPASVELEKTIRDTLKTGVNGKALTGDK